MKFASKEPMIRCFQLFYGTRECENMSSVTSRNDFIVEKYSVKLQETIFTVCNKIQEKIKKRSQLFCINIFKLYVTICDTMYFADKKVNSIHLS
jgi:dimeric dUTPase (all-alpha-NTP-PPase superfamily)